MTSSEINELASQLIAEWEATAEGIDAASSPVSWGTAMGVADGIGILRDEILRLSGESSRGELPSDLDS